MVFRKKIDKAGRTESYRAGETVAYEPDSDKSWRVERVDLDAERVALSQDGSTVWLYLRERTLAAAGSDLGTSAGRLFDPQTSVPVVRPTPPEALRAELRAMGLPEDEIDEYFKLAKEPDTSEGNGQGAQTGLAAGLMDAVRRVGDGERAQKDGADDPSRAEREPDTPGGIGALLRMMSTGERPTEETLRNLRTPDETPDREGGGGGGGGDGGGGGGDG